jgi:hypothetical protein
MRTWWRCQKVGELTGGKRLWHRHKKLILRLA